MKLRSIVENGYEGVENGYEGLEDADRFGDPEELRALLKVHKFMHLRRCSVSGRDGDMWRRPQNRRLRQDMRQQLGALMPIIRKIFDRQTILRMQHDMDWNPYLKISHEELDMVHQLIWQHPELQQWWDKIADAPERLKPSYGRDPEHLAHLRLNESCHGFIF
jgi:hypothetical protein